MKARMVTPMKVGISSSEPGEDEADHAAMPRPAHARFHPTGLPFRCPGRRSGGTFPPGKIMRQLAA